MSQHNNNASPDTASAQTLKDLMEETQQLRAESQAHHEQLQKLSENTEYMSTNIQDVKERLQRLEDVVRWSAKPKTTARA
ncbi:hypothetical protein H9P43_007278 [Blastocladiella emersonii ATCC 22665]|nr:hypothetical protein H9P43_007278 [Blastocladiella emersonii ATCC 22665]